MKKQIITVLVLLCILLCGCAQIELEKILPDGTIIRGKYTRQLNQNIEGFYLKSPDGWEVGFSKQESNVPTINLNLQGLLVAGDTQ